MFVRLEEKEYRCGLFECYENIARKAGYFPTERTLYDCRKVCVNRHIQDVWYEYYTAKRKAEDPSRSDEDIRRDITMVLLMYGTKVREDLEDDEVDVAEDFASEEECERRNAA